jgi:hypothetical protein
LVTQEGGKFFDGRRERILRDLIHRRDTVTKDALFDAGHLIASNQMTSRRRYVPIDKMPPPLAGGALVMQFWHNLREMTNGD